MHLAAAESELVNATRFKKMDGKPVIVKVLVDKLKEAQTFIAHTDDLVVQSRAWIKNNKASAAQPCPSKIRRSFVFDNIFSS